jgi:cell division septal protein FtsQ
MKFFRKKEKNIPRRRLNVDVGRNNFESSNDLYRRNQTLTGVVQNNQSPRIKTHHLSIKRRKVLGLFVIVLLSALVVWLLICNFTASVTIKVGGNITNNNIENSIYEKVIQDYFDINPIGRFKFLLDKSSLRSFVVSKLPEVYNIKQGSSVNLGVTEFNITMRNPVAGWLISDRQYFVDAEGVSFEKNYYDAPSVQIINQSDAIVQSGSAVASQRFLGFVGRVVNQSLLKGYTVTQAILPLNTTRQLEIRTKEGDYLVKLSIDRPVGEQIEDMLRAIKYFTDNGQKPAYIDVRVSGKAFYI